MKFLNSFVCAFCAILPLYIYGILYIKFMKCLKMFNYWHYFNVTMLFNENIKIFTKEPLEWACKDRFWDEMWIAASLNHMKYDGIWISVQIKIVFVVYN